MYMYDRGIICVVCISSGIYTHIYTLQYVYMNLAVRLVMILQQNPFYLVV